MACRNIRSIEFRTKLGVKWKENKRIILALESSMILSRTAQSIESFFWILIGENSRHTKCQTLFTLTKWANFLLVWRQPSGHHSQNYHKNMKSIFFLPRTIRSKTGSTPIFTCFMLSFCVRNLLRFYVFALSLAVCCCLFFMVKHQYYICSYMACLFIYMGSLAKFQ